MEDKMIALERRLQSDIRRNRHGIWGALALAASLSIATLGQYFHSNSGSAQGSQRKPVAASKEGLLLAGSTNASFRPAITEHVDWEAEKDVVRVFAHTFARYAKPFQIICDKTKQRKYGPEDQYLINYMPNGALSEMATYLRIAEERDPLVIDSLHAVVRATFETGFERDDGRTTPAQGYEMFETFYRDFLSHT